MNTLIPSASELRQTADDFNANRITPVQSSPKWENALNIATQECVAGIKQFAGFGDYKLGFYGISLLRHGYEERLKYDEALNKLTFKFILDLAKRFKDSAINITHTDDEIFFSWDRKLRVYTNDCEWVIAYSPEDASAVAEANYHESEKNEFEWEECPMTSTWTLAGEFTDSGEDEMKTFEEWINLKGRSYLGTTEY